MIPLVTNFLRRIKRFLGVEVVSSFEKVESRTIEITKTVDGYVMPVRETLFKRFPVLFSVLVTFGVSATFIGFEQMLLQYELLRNNPELILIFGVVVLVFTGTLYKKLS
jgi:hypothetical protein